MAVHLGGGGPAGQAGAAPPKEWEGCVSFRSVHKGHKTQEEDIISNALLWLVHPNKDPRANYDASLIYDEHPYARKVWDKWFHDNLHGKWGMKTFKTETSWATPPTDWKETIQGVDFSKPVDESAYQRTVRVVENVELTKNLYHYGRATGFGSECKKVHLVFVAGPCADRRQNKRVVQSTDQMWRSQMRTFDSKASTDYRYFKNCIASAITVGIEKAIDAECKRVIIPFIGCGLYAGDHQVQIRKEFPALIATIADAYSHRIDICCVDFSRAASKYVGMMRTVKMYSGDCASCLWLFPGDEKPTAVFVAANAGRPGGAVGDAIEPLKKEFFDAIRGSDPRERRREESSGGASKGPKRKVYIDPRDYFDSCKPSTTYKDVLAFLETEARYNAELGLFVPKERVEAYCFADKVPIATSLERFKCVAAEYERMCGVALLKNQKGGEFKKFPAFNRFANRDVQQVAEQLFKETKMGFDPAIPDAFFNLYPGAKGRSYNDYLQSLSGYHDTIKWGKMHKKKITVPDRFDNLTLNPEEMNLVVRAFTARTAVGAPRPPLEACSLLPLKHRLVPAPVIGAKKSPDSGDKRSRSPKGGGPSDPRYDSWSGHSGGGGASFSQGKRSGKLPARRGEGSGPRTNIKPKGRGGGKGPGRYGSGSKAGFAHVFL